MQEWSYYLPTKIVFGVGSFESAGKYAAEFKAKKILIVTGRGAMKKLGLTDKLISNLGGTKTVVFDGIGQNPDILAVEQGAEIAKKQKCDLVIALGGGSTMDAAKAIAAIAVNGRSAMEYFEGKREFMKKGLPLIAIPTTSGTASEMNKYSVLSDNKRKIKKALRNDFLVPDVAIIDPRLTLSMPRELTAATGLDTLCHGIESYWSLNATPVTEMFSLKAIGSVNENLPKAYNNGNDLNARQELCLASLYAGFAFGNTGTTDVHGLSYPLTTKFGLVHGFACAIYIPAFMEYNSAEFGEKILNIGKALGMNSIEGGIERFGEIMKGVNAPLRLRDIGVREKDFDMIIKEGLTKRNNPRELRENEVKGILRQIL